MKQPLFIRSSIFHCREYDNPSKGEYFEDGLLIIENGRIRDLGPYQNLCAQLGQETKILHLPHRLIIPGFIDAHLHYPQYKIIGSYGKQLIEWLNTYTFPEEQKFSDFEYASKIARLFFSELLSNGTTTAMSFCATYSVSVEAYFTEAKRLGLRMLGGKVMMDRHAPQGLLDDPESSYIESKQLIEHWHNVDRLSYVISPRFAPTSTPEQLSKAGKLFQEYNTTDSKKGISLQTHLNENLNEIAWVRSLFPERKHYLDVYDHYNLLDSRSVFGHAIHNSDDELGRLSDSGGKIALCPTSNLFIGSGLFDLQQLEEYGIACAFASDVGGGNSFSMFQVMNEAYKICQLRGYSLDPIKSFYLATLGGAHVLNMDDAIGNFLTGKEADFLVLDLQATPLLKEKISVCQNIEEILFSLIMLADERTVEQVYIMGERICERASFQKTFTKKNYA